MANAVRELAISLPFKIDANGKIAATADPQTIWRDRVRSVIGTSLGQRVYRPSFGCEATNSIFEAEEDVRNEVEGQVVKAFQSFLPLLALRDVTSRIEQSSLRIIVEISYAIPSGGEFTSQFGIATIDGTNPIVEEVSWQTT